MEILSPMNGNIWKILKKAGDAVEDAETVIILEAMKMEIEVVAPGAGTISEITVKEGDAVEANQVLGKIG